jgi:hypothetical protein
MLASYQLTPGNAVQFMAKQKRKKILRHGGQLLAEKSSSPLGPSTITGPQIIAPIIFFTSMYIMEIETPTRLILSWCQHTAELHVPPT